MTLHAEISGDITARPPLVLIHGFGGSAAAWDAVKFHLPESQPVIAYDLPGHRHSLQSEGRGGAGKMAKAILADLDARGLTSFHLAGHSMGGAVASLIAMRAGGKVLSLTLLAPGGMGPEEVVSGLAADRAVPGALEALQETYAAMFTEQTSPIRAQGVLPMDLMDQLQCKVTVIWGEDDAVLPFHQMDRLPVKFEKIHLAGTGHMLLDETPQRVAAVLTDVAS